MLPKTTCGDLAAAHGFPCEEAASLFYVRRAFTRCFTECYPPCIDLNLHHNPTLIHSQSLGDFFSPPPKKLRFRVKILDHTVTKQFIPEFTAIMVASVR